jgi:hypothetical protein
VETFDAALVPLLAVLGATVALVIDARGLPRDRPARALLVLLAAFAVVAVRRARAPRPLDTTPAARVAWADAHDNPYEALFAAKLWGRASDEGKLAYARRARAFHLFRTCTEAASGVATDGALAREAAELRAACAADELSP